MGDERSGLAARFLVGLTVVSALALGACGDSGDSASGSGEAAAADSAAAGAEREVAGKMRELRVQFNGSDGKGFCRNLTAAGREEVVALELVTVKAKGCEGKVTEFSKTVIGQGSPQRAIDVRRVSVSGDRARIVITGGLAGVRRVVPFRLQRVDGDWKLDDPISGPSRVIKTDLSIPLNP